MAIISLCPCIEAISSARRAFCTMKVATVFDSSEPSSMVRRQSGMISVESRKFITAVSSTWERRQRRGAAPERARLQTFTRAPMTPRLVSRRYSKGRVLETVLRNG